MTGIIYKISEQIHYKLNEVEIIIFEDAHSSFPSILSITAAQPSDEALNGEWI